MSINLTFFHLGFDVKLPAIFFLTNQKSLWISSSKIFLPTMNKIKRHLQTPVWIWILNKRHMISWWKPYKPVHLDVEASRWPFGGRTSQFCRSVVGWGAKWFELLLNIIDFRWSKLLTTCCQNRSSYSRTYATASNTRLAFRSWMWVGLPKMWILLQSSLKETCIVNAYCQFSQ